MRPSTNPVIHPFLNGSTLALLLLAAGCSGSPAQPGDGGSGGSPPPPEDPIPRADAPIVQLTSQSMLDVLFVIDNSPSIETFQTHLAAEFPAFIDRLKGLPGGLPDLHVGVITSDLGIGQVTSGVPGCQKQPFGDQGYLQASPGWTYTWNAGSGRFDMTRKTCTPPAGSFISASGGATEGTTNYSGSMADAFACISTVGAIGCGFESVLGSMQRALGVDPWFPMPSRPALGYDAGAPDGGVFPDNAGFLRPDAYLAIVLVTNEDDCSVPPDSVLFDPSSRNLSGVYGPLTSYRCNAFGHKCDGKMAPMKPTDPQFAGGTTYSAGSCESAEDGTLLRVADVIAQVKTLKASSDTIFVAALAGPPAPYVVGLDSQLSAASGYSGELWPKVQPSCAVASDSGEPARTAAPAPRIKQFVDGLGGIFQSICDASWGNTLTALASRVEDRLAKPLCIGAKLVDSDNDTANGIQPVCSVTEYAAGSSTELPACDDPSGAAPTVVPCWYLRADTACASSWNGSSGRAVAVARAATLPAAADAYLQVSCPTCWEYDERFTPAADPRPGCNY